MAGAKQDYRSLLAGGRFLVTFGLKSDFSKLEKLLLLLLLAAFGFGFLRAVSYPIWAWDALSTWGLKAKAFYLAQGLDMSRFEAHNYYPSLVPLLMAYLYFWLGSVADHLVKAVFPLWGGAIVVLFFSFLRRLGVNRAGALGAAAFLVLNGATFMTHLFIAYADLALTYYQLAAAGLLYLWLWEEAPAGSGPLIACMCGGMAWSKYEGWPLVMITFLAAGLTLLWLRPPRVWKRILSLVLMGLGGWFFSLPWRLFVSLQGLEVGRDHIGGLSLPPVLSRRLVCTQGPDLDSLFRPALANHIFEFYSVGLVDFPDPSNVSGIICRQAIWRPLPWLTLWCQLPRRSFPCMCGPRWTVCCCTWRRRAA